MQLDFKSVIVILALLGALMLAGVAGTKLGHVIAVAESADAARTAADTILKLTTDKATLAKEVATNNALIELAEAKSKAAMQAQSMAEQHARDLALMSEERMKKLDKALVNAVSVSDVLAKYWELRK